MESTATAAAPVFTGKSFKRSIVYGSLATPIKKPDTDHTHKWTVYVRPFNEKEDMSKYVKRVTFKLHDSFAQPLRQIDEAPWEVNETGWGEFTIQIKLSFHDPNQRPITLNHQLRLYPPEDMGQLKTSKPVLSEFYDEIVFEPATELMAEILQSTEADCQPEKSSKYAELQAEEAKELAKYQSIIDQVNEQLKEVQAKLSNAPMAPPPVTAGQPGRKRSRH